MADIGGFWRNLQLMKLRQQEAKRLAEESKIRNNLAKAKLEAIQYDNERRSQTMQLLLKAIAQKTAAQPAQALLQESDATRGFALDPQAKQELQGIVNRPSLSPQQVIGLFAAQEGKYGDALKALGGGNEKPPTNAFQAYYQGLVQQGVDPLEATKRAISGSQKPKDYGDNREAYASSMFGRGFADLTGDQKEKVNRRVFQERLQVSREQQAGKPLPSAIANKVSDLNSLISFANDIDQLFDENFVGKVQGVGGAIRQFTGNITDREVEFRQIVYDVKDFLLRARSGAQINEQEYRRLSRLTPNPTDEPNVFRSKLRRFAKSTVEMRDQKVKIATTPGNQLIGNMPHLKFDVETPKLGLKGASHSDELNAIDKRLEEIRRELQYAK